MAKIGTAHFEVKPVLNEEALATIGTLIESSVEAAVTRALEAAFSKRPHNVRIVRVYGEGTNLSPDELDDIRDSIMAAGEPNA